MSPLGKSTTQKESSNPLTMLKPYLLPAYIVLSALFILYVAYGYLKVSVYQTGALNGYNSAYSEIANAALDPQSCQAGLNIPTADGKGVTLLNVECLQAAQPQEGAQEPAAVSQ